MPGKSNTNLTKTPKNARRKYFRRAFYRLYNTRSGYRENYPPHSSPDCRADYAYNQPRNSQPGASSTGFHLRYPDYTQRKSDGRRNAEKHS